MKLPRDLSGEKLVKILTRLGYEVIRSSGSHIRLVHPGPPQNGVTVPLHKTLKAGTLNGILRQVSRHLGISKRQILKS